MHQVSRGGQHTRSPAQLRVDRERDGVHAGRRGDVRQTHIACDEQECAVAQERRVHVQRDRQAADTRLQGQDEVFQGVYKEF